MTAVLPSQAVAGLQGAADIWQVLLHDWNVLAEYDGGYTVGRCRVCGEEELLDLRVPT